MKSPFVKDAFHDAMIKGENLEALSKKKTGTKFSPVYKLKIEGGKPKLFICGLAIKQLTIPLPKDLKKYFQVRKEEADDFYAAILATGYIR